MKSVTKTIEAVLDDIRPLLERLAAYDRGELDIDTSVVERSIKETAAKLLGSAGGQQAAANMTPEQRTARAKKARAAQLKKSQ